MNLAESFRTALFNLLANKLRSFLTMLGVIIGVASVVAMVGLGQGMRAQILAQLTSLGSNILTVIPGRVRQGPGSFFMARGGGDILKYEYFRELREAAFPGIRTVTTETMASFVVTAGRESVVVNVVGTTPEFLEVRNFSLLQGRSFNGYDCSYSRRVAVLGHTVAQDLFGNPAASLGQSIRIGRNIFTVVGVLEPKTAGGQDLGNHIFVPLTTHQRYLTGNRYLQNIIVQVDAKENIPLVSAWLSDFFTRKIGNPEEFSILNQQDILETVESVTGSITLFLAIIAGISLLVGGIGIMNIMLVSVAERTREIGLRKAIGARPRDILLQFLLESSLLSLVGGGVGVLLGVLAGRSMASFSQFSFVVSPQVVALALSVSLVVGLFFGIYPARRASRLDPIAALRYE
ncbi:ABC transporter permease [Candidatus Caldatribacterium sp.]|uniref:ABC transporter permease n=1 Tax=Candidatus Caldatribacterium sp. TaxID=2282143 RepID=UPI00299287E4|nr:ABC transporter permease [Candidatus Caldatribacterium sp.]MDW8081027.1 ABC transporter permease [Candidatus Calescibacterium sp.]